MRHQHSESDGVSGDDNGAQKALIEKARNNGGSVEVTGRGEKVTARTLMKVGIMKLTGVGVYYLAE